MKPLHPQLLRPGRPLQRQLAKTGRPRTMTRKAVDDDPRPAAGRDAGPLAPYEWPTILDQLGQPAFVHDSERRILRCNGAYAAAAGRPLTQIIGMPFWQVLPRLPEPPPPCATSGPAQGSNRVEIEMPDGRFLESHEMAARCPDGNFWYCRHLFDDITERKRLEAALVREKEALAREKRISDAIIESASNAFFLVDGEARLVRWNSHLRKCARMSDAQLPGLPALSLVHAGDRALAQAKFLTVLATGYTQAELRIGDAGTATYLLTARRVILDGAPFVAGFGTDITERKHAEAALAEHNSFSDVLVENIPGVFCVVDDEGNYYRWNSNLNRLTGLSDAELAGRSALLAVVEEERAAAAARMREAFEHGYAKTVLHVTTQDRGNRAFLTTARRFQFKDASYLIGVGIDTTDQLDAMRALEHEARTDSLTSIANRAFFLDRADDEFARCRRYGHPLSVWMLDLDHFKAVNDSHGHQAGDAVLRAFVAICRQVVRDWDTIGRMGGEEFGVLLPETDAHQALLVAERLRQAVAATAVPLDAGASVAVTVSIGITSVTPDDADVHAVLARADVALYEAKNTGRDKVCIR